MKPTPICEVLRRIRPLSRRKKQLHLSKVIESLPKRSVRRHELELLLRVIINSQLDREIRQDNNRSVA